MTTPCLQREADRLRNQDVSLSKVRDELTAADVPDEAVRDTVNAIRQGQIIAGLFDKLFGPSTANRNSERV